MNPNAIRIGLSATPWRNDNRDLEIYAYTGEIIERKVTSSELIHKGYLVPVVILVYWRYNIKLPKEIRDEILKYKLERKGVKAWQIIKKYIYFDEGRINEIIEIANNLPKPCLILVREREFGRKLLNVFHSKGIGKVEFVSSYVKGEERHMIFNQVRNGYLDILIATTLADEGLDLPPLRSLIVADGLASRTRVFQRIGRIVRPWNGKKFAIVIDIVDNTIYFKDHGIERIRLYRTEPLWKVYEITDFNKLITIIEKLKEIQ